MSVVTHERNFTQSQKSNTQAFSTHIYAFRRMDGRGINSELFKCMRKFYLFAATAFLLTPALNTWADDSSQCLGRMPSGPYKGQCLDLSEDRTVSRLTQAEKQKLADELHDPRFVSPDYEVVKNFSPDGKKFWTAIIPIKRVKDIVYQTVDILPNLPFKGVKIKDPVNISHSQLRFELKPEGDPVQLIDNSKNPPSLIDIPKGKEKDDLVFALWAVRAQGHQEIFNPFHGASGQYVATYALQGWDLATDWIVKGGYPTHQFTLARTPEQSQAALKDALDMANQRGMSIMYNTNYNSCSNAAFDVLLKAYFNKPNPSTTPIDKAKKFQQSADPEGQLRFYGMIDTSKPLPSIQDEEAQLAKDNADAVMAGIQMKSPVRHCD